MKVITLTQGSGSAEWLDWRRNGIGASDISVLMGNHPQLTPRQLWELKCGYRKEEPINKAMAHGIKYEEQAREWMNVAHNLHLVPVCVEDSKESIFRASLDGYDFDQEVLCEIKCPVSEKVLEKAFMSQSVPGHWFDQIQWQIMIAQPKRALLAIWDYRKNGCIVLDMFGMQDKFEEMQKRGKEFWRKVQSGAPPATQTGDFEQIEGAELHEILNEYGVLDDQEKGAKKRKEELKKEVVKIADGRNILAYGFRIQQMKGRTSYDMDLMRQDGIDVDKYVKGNDYYYAIYKTKDRRAQVVEDENHV